MKTDPARPRRRLSRIASFVLASTLATMSLAAVATATASAATTGPTVVSLTFDDSDADQLAASTVMKNAGLTGTFYTVDGYVGAPGYLSRSDLATIAANGNEIAGHTVSHPDLIDIDPAEAQRQICDDRATLQSWGYKPTDFAYPFSDANPAVEKLVKGCGYTTARGLGDVKSAHDCTDCDYAETFPPADPFYLQAPDQVDSTATLSSLEKQVTRASNHAGGWVIMTFHHICDDIGAVDCQADQSIPTALFQQFITWLAKRVTLTPKQTSVLTVDQAVRSYKGKSYPAYVPAKAIAPRPAAAVGVNSVANPSLETANPYGTGLPNCYSLGGYGTNTPTLTTVPGHTGNVAEQLTVSNYTSGDADLFTSQDLGTCSPTIVPGHVYNVSIWYKSTGTAQFALYYRNSQNVWSNWTFGPYLPTATTWTQAQFTSPGAPPDAVGLSFGLVLISNGTLTTDDYSAIDTGTTAPALPVAASARLGPLPS